MRRFGSLQPTHNDAVFQLKPGQISAVIEDASGLYIYKVDSQTVLSLQSADAEIRQVVAERNFRRELCSIFEPIQPSLNSQYFGKSKIQFNACGAGEEEGEREREGERPPEAPPASPPKPQPK